MSCASENLQIQSHYYGQDKMECCIVYMNKTHTIPQIWKYWTTLTMTLHWNITAMLKILVYASNAQ